MFYEANVVKFHVILCACHLLRTSTPSAEEIHRSDSPAAFKKVTSPCHTPSAIPFLHLCSLHIPRETHHRLAGFRLHACAQHMMHNTVLLLHCPPSATPDTFSAMSFLHFFFKCIAPPHRQSTTLLWVHKSVGSPSSCGRGWGTAPTATP